MRIINNIKLFRTIMLNTGLCSATMRHTLLLAVIVISHAAGCSTGGPAELSSIPAYTRGALRAPRPAIHPEQKTYRPRLILRDSQSVRRAFREYQGKRRAFLVDAFSRHDRFAGDFERIFRRQGIPVEVSNLAIIESRLVASARSRRGAAGLWQFMPRTARKYGLKVGLLRDERKDPVKSTEAAAKYLAELHNRFDDWFLAIAAYNCGPSRLARIIRREGTDDFFELAQRKAVSKETRLLVARFIAVTMILRNKETYGF